MKADDLLSMLDLGGKEPHPPPADSPLVMAPTVPVDASPTALAVDAWGLRRGRDLVAESERLRKVGTDDFAAADFFAAAFDPDPRLLDSCTDARRRQFVAQLLETPEYRSLHAATRLDDTAAAIAAAHFAEQFASLSSDDGAASPADEVDEEMAILRAVVRAVTEARADVDELHDAVGAVGMGMGMPGVRGCKVFSATITGFAAAKLWSTLQHSSGHPNGRCTHLV